MKWTHFFKCKLPKLTAVEIDNLYTCTSIEELEVEAKNLPEKETIGPDGFMVTFIKHLHKK